jgi:multidrug resistance efflux pump
VVNVNLDAEGTLINNQRIIHIDDMLDKINFSDTKKSIELLEEMLKINNEIANSLKETVKRQKGYFFRISKLSTTSKTQKDNAYNSFTSAKTQYLTTKEKIVSLKKQILDMIYKASKLEDTLSKKSIIPTNKYLYKLMVRKGDFVAPGSALAQLQDISRAKLVLFLEAEEIKDIEDKTIYFNGKKTKYKIDKVWNVTDEKFISSYRAEIYIPSPKNLFSKLIKVEIK